jgi:Domain of unknown function (DUF4288)
MKRYAAKLLFQFRVVVSGEPGRMRIVEERIVLLSARTAKEVLRKAKTFGKEKEFNFINDSGDRVYFEFVGVLDLLELGLEVEKGEVWYEIKQMLLPMERRSRILPTEAKLSALKWERRAVRARRRNS